MNNELTVYIIRIVNTKDFLAKAENIKVRAINAESAATMAIVSYKKITGEDIGDPILLRAEQYYMIFLTEREYFLEVIGCYECR